MSHYPDTGTVAGSIFMLEDHRSQLNDDLAILSMLHIALKVREALPGAAEIVLARSDQEPALVPSGQYLAADGTRLDAPDDVITFSCGNLNDQTEGTWMPFVSGVAPGGLYRLKIDDLLAACETGPASRSLTAEGKARHGAAGPSSPYTSTSRCTPTGTRRKPTARSATTCG